MSKLLKSLAVAFLALFVTVAAPSGDAEARHGFHGHRHHHHHHFRHHHHRFFFFHHGHRHGHHGHRRHR